MNSDSSDNISESIKAVKHLDIKGFALSMPFKIDALSCMSSQDWCDESVLSIGATNTNTNTKGILKAYNTDWIDRNLTKSVQPGQ